MGNQTCCERCRCHAGTVVLTVFGSDMTSEFFGAWEPPSREGQRVWRGLDGVSMLSITGRDSSSTSTIFMASDLVCEIDYTWRSEEAPHARDSKQAT